MCWQRPESCLGIEGNCICGNSLRESQYVCEAAGLTRIDRYRDRCWMGSTIQYAVFKLFKHIFSTATPVLQQSAVAASCVFFSKEKTAKSSGSCVFMLFLQKRRQDESIAYCSPNCTTNWCSWWSAGCAIKQQKSAAPPSHLKWATAASLSKPKKGLKKLDFPTLQPFLGIFFHKPSLARPYLNICAQNEDLSKNRRRITRAVPCFF